MNGDLSALDIGVVAGFVVVGIWAGMFKRPAIWAMILPFALAYSFWVEIGTRWSPAKVYPLALSFGIVVRGAIEPVRLRVFFPPRWLFGFGVFSVAVTVYYYGVFSAELISAESDGPLFQSANVRTFVQLMAYALSAVYYLVARYSIGSGQDFDMFVRSYLWASISLVGYGVYQGTAFYANWPFRGIIYAPGTEGFGAFEVAGVIVPRLNSLSNEPKQLALFLLPSLVVILLVQAGVLECPRGAVVNKLSLVAHCVVFALTFAVSGMLSLVLVVIVVCAFAGGLSVGKSLRLIGVGSLVAVVSVWIIGEIVRGPSIQEMVKARVGTVMEDSGRVENRVVEYLMNDPRRIVFGMGPGNYNFVLREMDVSLAGPHGVDPLDSALLTMLIDFGVVGGLALLLPIGWSVVRIVRKGRQAASEEDRGRCRLAAALGVVAIMQLPFVGALPHLLMFVGLIDAIDQVVSRSRNNEGVPVYDRAVARIG